MKILWANMHCLLDSSSGASLSAREILKQLSRRGHKVRILGSTVFDSPNGTSILGSYWDERILNYEHNSFFEVIDGEITHTVHKTGSLSSAEMTSHEARTWASRYRTELKYFKPDVLLFYGGGVGDFIPAEAEAFNVLVGAYLVNGSFRSTRWCRDVDIFLTDTKATRDYYRNKLNIDPIPIGKFIEEERICKSRAPEKLLYINPSLEKGAGVVIVLAQILERIAPDIDIEIVESRGNWSEILAAVNRALGRNESYLPNNITVTKNTSDIASVYARTKILLVPSLWYESGARVIAEAQLCGIPVVASDSGGNREMVGPGGAIFMLPPACFKEPYLEIPTEESLFELGKWIKGVFADPDQYGRLSSAARRHATKKHDAAKNARELERVLLSQLEKKKPWGVGRIKKPAHSWFNEKRIVGDEGIIFPLEKGKKGVFVDCGGYDGCSAVKFIANNPKFDSITFEPNPVFWKYYDDVPTTLVRSGVAGSDGEREFRVDNIDGDGSSFLKEKKIDYSGSRENEEFFQESWHCVDISKIVKSAMKYYDIIILKLDIEGAEYEVLEKLIKEDLLKSIECLYVEWHWQKCGFSEEFHLKIADEVERQCTWFEWDALDFSLHARNFKGMTVEHLAKSRKDLLKIAIDDALTSYQNIKMIRDLPVNY